MCVCVTCHVFSSHSSFTHITPLAHTTQVANLEREKRILTQQKSDLMLEKDTLAVEMKQLVRERGLLQRRLQVRMVIHTSTHRMTSQTHTHKIDLKLSAGQESRLGEEYRLCLILLVQQH